MSSHPGGLLALSAFLIEVSSLQLATVLSYCLNEADTDNEEEVDKNPLLMNKTPCQEPGEEKQASNCQSVLPVELL